MPRGSRQSTDDLHPSMRSRRVRAHLASVRISLASSALPPGFERRDGARSDERTPDLELLDLLTAAMDLADDEDLQMLVAYARTSMIIRITR